MFNLDVKKCFNPLVYSTKYENKKNCPHIFLVPVIPALALVEHTCHLWI